MAVNKLKQLNNKKMKTDQIKISDSYSRIDDDFYTPVLTIDNEVEYYEYIITSIINGNHSQAKSLIINMPKKNRKNLCKWFIGEKYFNGDHNYYLGRFIDLI
jgi:hypothetical protein